MSPLTDSQKREVEKNYRLVGFFTSRLQSRFEPGDLDDLRQEIALQLLRAVQSPARERGFALATVTGVLTHHAVKRMRRARRPMTGIPKGGMKPTVVSMSAPVGDEMDLTFGDTLPDRGTLPDEFAACREQLRGLHPKTDIERRVLLGRAEGHTFGDIGASLGCSGTWARCILDKVTDSMSPP